MTVPEPEPRRHNRAMLAVRVAVFAFAVAACAWFVVGLVQTHDQSKATGLIDQPGTPSPALTKRILSLLDGAGRLNPDRNIDLLRSQALSRAGRAPAAVATAERVVRAEPDNVDAWIVLGFAARRIHPNIAQLALEKEIELAPRVPAAP
jgi:hypothetical protein